MIKYFWLSILFAGCASEHYCLISSKAYPAAYCASCETGQFEYFGVHQYDGSVSCDLDKTKDNAWNDQIPKYTSGQIIVEMDRTNK